MNIGEVEKHSGVPAKNIRYYEEIGLVHPNRLANRYRNFSEKDIHKLGFVHQARGVGFSLSECRLLLSLYEDKNRASADVKAIALKHMNRIDRKIDDLLKLRDVLAVLIEARRDDNRPGYPILCGLIGKDFLRF
jgi:Cu(I)-responsive transcriptional regulator